jgi:hypothetical protein
MLGPRFMHPLLDSKFVFLPDLQSKSRVGRPFMNAREDSLQSIFTYIEVRFRANPIVFWHR